LRISYTSRLLLGGLSLANTDLLDDKARSERISELVNLLGIAHGEGVKVLAATNLELGEVLGLLNLDS